MWDLWESTGNGPLVSPPVTKCRYAVSHAVRCLGRAPPTPLERPGREGPRADGVFASGASQQTSIIIIIIIIAGLELLGGSCVSLTSPFRLQPGLAPRLWLADCCPDSRLVPGVKRQ